MEFFLQHQVKIEVFWGQTETALIAEQLKVCSAAKRMFETLE